MGVRRFPKDDKKSMMKAKLRPGSLSRPACGGPIGIWHVIDFRLRNKLYELSDGYFEDADGVGIVVASSNDDRLVITSSGKIGWASVWDLLEL